MRGKHEVWIMVNRKWGTKKLGTRLSQLITMLCCFFLIALCMHVCHVRVSMCVLFSSVSALLMGCEPGLYRKAASSIRLGINPGIMTLMPSWVEAKLFKKYWLPVSLSPLFLFPPLSIFCSYLYRLSLWFCSISFFFLLFFCLFLCLFALFFFLLISLSLCSQWPAGLIFAN